MADSSDAAANSLGLDLDALKIKDDPESSGAAEPPKEDKSGPEPETSDPEGGEKVEEEAAEDEEAKSPTSEGKKELKEKKKPYVNPERVKTGGAQRVRRVCIEVH